MVVGDMRVGKRSFLRRYIYDESPEAPVHLWRLVNYHRLKLPLDSSPILPNGQPKRQQDNKKATSTTNHGEREPKMVSMRIYYYRLSSLLSGFPIPLYVRRNFANAKVIALCYDCSRPESLHKAIYRWHPIILHCAPNIPIFLIGCKSDRKDALDQAQRSCVTTEEAKRAARQIGAIDVFECTAMEGDSVKTAGDTLAWYSYYSDGAKTESAVLSWRNRLRSLLFSAE
ncbi:P-loop containing nucleoside triphosphate hydrolase protein [Serendipita vermifera]|nr:P-loop containing nucleoside triphosphate hydrolase protein [Serendipita vermifera]